MKWIPDIPLEFAIPWIIIFLVIFTLPWTGKVLYKLYKKYIHKKEHAEDKKDLTEKEKKRLERHRRKEIRRQKRKLHKT